LLIAQPETVKTPLASAALQPVIVAPLAPVPEVIARERVELSPVMIFPAESSTVTCTDPLNEAPTTLFDGDEVKTSFAAEPAVMLKELLVAAATPLPESVAVRV
jgi:hypothetical protein